MAVPGGTTQTFQGVGIREDLSDIIYDISPTDTPFLSMAKRGKATQTYHEWQTDALASADGTNAVIEGNDAVVDTAVATVRLGNYTQIMDKVVSISGTYEAVNAAGRKSELSYQLTKRSRELKRDMESRLTSNYANTAGAAGAASQTASIEAWITTNTSRGTGGSNGGFAAGKVTAAGDASSTNIRTFTEAMLKAVIKSAWDSGGEPKTIMTGSFNKQKASGFSGIATLYRDTAGSMKPTSIMGAADIYVSDFGEHRIVPNRFNRDRSALVLDMDYWSVDYLRSFTQSKLAKTGDSEKRQLLVEFSLCSKNEAASGVVADLTTS
jgi:hypothetical protein